jgi:choline dehydrogenase-like flavoprotein
VGSWLRIGCQKTQVRVPGGGRVECSVLIIGHRNYCPDNRGGRVVSTFAASQDPMLIASSDQNEDFITIPAITSGNIPSLGGGPRGSKYDWNLTGIPQAILQGRSVPTPAGKVIGGGTVLNGMVFHRGSKSDYDRWEELGNLGWSFDGLLPYFKKSETFTPPDPDLADWQIKYNLASHGFKGFVQSSFSRFVWPSTSKPPSSWVDIG